METTKITTDIPYLESEIPASNNSGWLARTLAKAFPLSWETALIIAITTAAIFTRLWELGQRVMSHDESLHVYYSWLLATGKGFVHNPMMHGPFLFDATALMNVLLGSSDATSRLVPAFLGIFIVIAIPQFLKPWLGQAGALMASTLLLISPFISYFSRYIRHDILVIAWALLAVVAIFRCLADHRERYLYLLTAALALMLSTMEMGFIYLAIFSSYLVLSAIAKYHFSWKELLKSADFDLLVVLATLGAFFSSPIALLVLNPLVNRFTGTPFIDMKVLDTQGIDWINGVSGLRLWGLFAVFSIAATALGLWWNRKRWLKLVTLFMAITLPLFTTFFTNPAGLGTGFIGSLGYWLSQQGVGRGSQPWYYYLIVFPLYEYLPLIGGFVAAIVFIVRRKMLSNLQRAFLSFLIWWTVWIFIALSVAGEKMPWLSTHIAIPFILLTGWWVGRLLENAPLWGKNIREHLQIAFHWSTLGLVGIMVVLTVRTSLAVNYLNYDYSTEWIDYAHGAPGVKWALNDIASIANHTGAGRDLKIAYDDAVSWPMTWYLRDYPNQAFYGAEPNRQALDTPIVIAGSKNWTKVETILGSRYHRFELTRLWWPLEDYKNLTWERIRFALANPAMRSAIWDILWNRDFSKYAVLTGQNLEPPASWPLADRMRIYVQKDVAAQMLHMSLGSAMLEDLPAPVDAYAAVQRQIKPTQMITGAGLNAPRGIAVAPDGSIYVADTGSSRIIRFDASGEVVTTWGSRTPDGQVATAPGTFTEPWGVAVDAHGNVYVADTWNHRVQKLDADGNFLMEWGQAGQLSDGPDRLWGPRGIAVGPDGRIYITDTGNKRVVVIDGNGNFLFEFRTEGEGLLDEPVGIALGPDSRVYVADTWNMRVSVYSKDGVFQTAWPVQGWAGDSLDNKPYLAIDAQSRVYITDPEGYRLIVFSSLGESLAVFGQYGPEEDSFGLPVGLAIGKDESLWVVDAGNNRLEKFSAWNGP